MIVRYVRERGYKGEGKDPWVSLYKKYVALSVTFSLQEQCAEISVLDDLEKTPILIDLSYFDIIDSRIPENWCFLNLQEGYCRLTPQEFDGDFWDEFHDGHPEAEAVFDKVMEKLHEFHGYEYIPPKRD